MCHKELVDPVVENFDVEINMEQEDNDEIVDSTSLTEDDILEIELVYDNYQQAILDRNIDNFLEIHTEYEKQALKELVEGLSTNGDSAKVEDIIFGQTPFIPFELLEFRYIDEGIVNLHLEHEFGVVTFQVVKDGFDWKMRGMMFLQTDKTQEEWNEHFHTNQSSQQLETGGNE